jgi:hypothetical protein
MAAIFVLGILNSFACYCHWRALAISQTGTSVLAQADDVIAIALGYAILGETRYVNTMLAAGITLSLGSTFLLAMRKSSGAERESFRGLVGWVFGYCLIWGTAVFSYRFLSLHGVAVPTFLFCWYGGSVLGSWIVMRAMGKTEAGPSATWTQVRGVALLAFLTWVALLVMYLMSSRAPITFTQPTLQASEVVFPSIIGLWLFKEKDQFKTWKSRMLFGTAFAGGLLSAFAYR